MKLFRLLLLTGIILLLTTTHAQATSERLYIEEIDSYSRVDGETLRWDSKREFAIQDYQVFDREMNGTTLRMVNITQTDESNYGIVHNVTKELRRINFVPEIDYWENGDLKNIDWDVEVFRLNATAGEPFRQEAADVLTDLQAGHKRYDLYFESTYFKVALEYFEYHMIDGEKTKVQVNTELATDNTEDGLVYRSALHIIKRAPDGTILYDYNYAIKETNDLYSLLNLVDQPYLWVPAQFGAVILAVYIYMRIVRYWKDNGYKIVKGGENEDITD